MNGMKVVFNKELKRVFKDPKLIFSLFILPIIMMVGLYSLIGFLGTQESKNTEEHISVVSIQNAPADLEGSIKDFTANADITYLQADESLEPVKDNIYKGNVDLLVVFPDNFSQDIAEYKEGSSIPDVQTFYNPSENYSQRAHETFLTALKDNYQKALLSERMGGLDMLTVFTIDNANENSIIQDDAKAAGKFLSMMLPYLITILLFAGTMSLGTDAITGEKERGTMASMLVTPIGRSEIVLGKLLALTVLSILSATVYVIALAITLPKTMGSMSGDSSMAITFSAEQLMMIAVIILTLAFLYVALVGIVSVFAKTVKESTTYITPVYFIVIIAGIFTMISPSEGHQTFEYLIPIYNCSIALGEIFSKEITMLHFIMTFGVSLIFGGGLTFLIVKAFNSERIMFNA